MNGRTVLDRGLELQGIGVEALDADELMSIGGGGVILTGCLIAVGGAAVAVVGVVVGAAVYAYLHD